MKYVLLFLLILPSAAFAQQNKVSPYGSGFGFIQFNGPTTPALGVGINAGAKVSGVGLGAGFEAFPVFKDEKIGSALYGDLRYTFEKGIRSKDDKRFLIPYIAINYGKVLWKITRFYGSATNNTTNISEGKYFFAAEIGTKFLQKANHGLFLGLAYKRFAIKDSYINKTTISNAGTPIPLTETSGSFTGSQNSYCVKLGYQF